MKSNHPREATTLEVSVSRNGVAGLWRRSGRSIVSLLREEAIMSEQATLLLQLGDVSLGEAIQWAGAFLAGFKSSQTRRAYRRDLDCRFAFCAAHQVHPSKLPRGGLVLG